MARRRLAFYRMKEVRVPGVVVAALMFVIVAVGSMVNARLQDNVDSLRVTVVQANNAYVMEQKRVTELTEKLKLTTDDDFIANEARTRYGYLAEGEIRYVVTNPEVLWDNGVPPVDGATDQGQP